MNRDITCKPEGSEVLTQANGTAVEMTHQTAIKSTSCRVTL